MLSIYQIFAKDKNFTYVVSIAEFVFKVLFGLNVVVAQVGGAARFSNLAHVAMFVFICPARKKCFPENDTNTWIHDKIAL